MIIKWILIAIGAIAAISLILLVGIYIVICSTKDIFDEY
jgi:hypothetical protein